VKIGKGLTKNNFGLFLHLEKWKVILCKKKGKLSLLTLFVM
jgi:hypothetical protein